MYIGIGFVAATLLYFLLRRENSRRERGDRDEVIVGLNDTGDVEHKNGTFDSIEEAKREKGDHWSGYRYTL